MKTIGDMGMKKIKLLASVVLLGFSAIAIADEGIQAPLGLKWGESKENLTKNYNASPADKNDSRLRLYSLGNPPVKVPGFDEFYGVVDEKYGLVKVIVVENISGDAYGSQGVEDYKKLKNILSKKYGKPSDQYEYIGRDIYKESDEFYQCLAYQGCGAYSSFYKPAGGGVIGLELKGQRRGEGFLTINYESTLFDKVIKERDSESQTKAEQGL